MMLSMIVAGALLVWLICGIVAYGLTFAFFQKKWPTLAEETYWSDFRLALLVGIIGPFGIAMNVVMGNVRHGFKWR